MRIVLLEERRRIPAHYLPDGQVLFVVELMSFYIVEIVLIVDVVSHDCFSQEVPHYEGREPYSEGQY